MQGGQLCNYPGIGLFWWDGTSTIRLNPPVNFHCKECPTVRASPVMLNMWPSLVVYSFATPPIKLKLGHQIGGGLLIANHMDQSLWRAAQKHWAAVRSYLLHSFLQVHSALRLVPATVPCAIMLSQTPFSWVKAVQIGFSSSIFTLQDHILSTAGDALRASHLGPQASLLVPMA